LKDLYFIAIVPDEPLLGEITEIKQIFARDYFSKHSLRSPGHITLVPPFRSSHDILHEIEKVIVDISSVTKPFQVVLNGFSSFPPRVIYIKPLKSRDLLKLYYELNQSLEYLISELGRSHRPFRPHITVGFRDLSEDLFFKAWEFFKDQKFEHTFIADSIYLLKHYKDGWKIHKEFPFENRFD
jgi:2'-5' RNA ligase